MRSYADRLDPGVETRRRGKRDQAVAQAPMDNRTLPR
jgi:hypothetical protein